VTQEPICDLPMVKAEYRWIEHRTRPAWLKAEIERLQEAKRRALTIADERSKENVKLRAALDLI
jgi:hypothetical protein